MQELRLPDVELKPGLLVRAEPPAQAYRYRSAPPAYGQSVEALRRRNVQSQLNETLSPGKVNTAHRIMVVSGGFTFIAVVAIAAVWFIGYLTHASGLQRGAVTAARNGGAVAVGIIAITLIGSAVWSLARMVIASIGDFVSTRKGARASADPARTGKTNNLVSASQAGRVDTTELKVGAVVLAIGPDDTPDDPEISRWLKLRRPDHAYHLIRIICSVDGGSDIRVTELKVRVDLRAVAGTGSKPQIISMLPRTSRSDTQVKKTVKFGANLKLIEASRQEESNEARGQTAVIARGELQQTATWQLSRAADLDEEKQFLLGVERPATTPAQATVALTATVLRSGEMVDLFATYADNPLDLS